MPNPAGLIRGPVGLVAVAALVATLGECNTAHQGLACPNGRYQVINAQWYEPLADGDRPEAKRQMVIKIDTSTGDTWELMTGQSTGLFPHWVPIPWPEPKQTGPSGN